MEVELAIVKGLLESFDELSAKDFPQHRFGKKVVLSGANPAGVIEGKTASGNDAMDMGVKTELLTPGVQHTEEADLCTQAERIASHFEKCLRTGTEQEIVEYLLVLQDQWRQPAGQCEHNVQVAGREKLSSTRRNPSFASRRLTLWAVPIAAAVIRDGAMTTAGALVDMAAECGGTTARNS
jgi:hypothetical protein